MKNTVDQDHLYFDADATGTQYLVYPLTGSSPVAQGIVIGNEIVLEGNIPSGIYILSLEQEGVKSISKIIQP